MFLLPDKNTDDVYENMIRDEITRDLVLPETKVRYSPRLVGTKGVWYGAGVTGGGTGTVVVHGMYIEGLDSSRPGAGRSMIMSKGRMV